MISCNQCDKWRFTTSSFSSPQKLCWCQIPTWGSTVTYWCLLLLQLCRSLNFTDKLGRAVEKASSEYVHCWLYTLLKRTRFYNSIVGLTLLGQRSGQFFTKHWTTFIKPSVGQVMPRPQHKINCIGVGNLTGRNFMFSCDHLHVLTLINFYIIMW